MAETETLTIFVETRPRRDVGTSRDRDHNPGHNSLSLSLPAQDFMTGPFLLSISVFIFSFIILFCLVPCGRFNWLYVSLWAHVNIIVSYRVTLRSPTFFCRPIDDRNQIVFHLVALFKSCYLSLWRLLYPGAQPRFQSWGSNSLV